MASDSSRTRANTLAKPAANPNLWALDPQTVFLNHGSFGACPRAVLDVQQGWRERLEHQPLQLLGRDLEPLMDTARTELARFVNADPRDLVFVSCATAGVNAVLRSFPLKRGDEVLVTDQEYNACRNVLDFVAQNAGAKVVVAKIPFPLRSADDVVEAVLEKTTRRTRLLLIDHVTSQTGMVFPVECIVREMSERGVETLVDGAHGPGMVPLDLKKLGAAAYTGNCHKWLCSPKGSALLHVRRDLQKFIRPPVISHGANSSRTDRSQFQIEFGWQGTFDPSAFLAVPAAMEFMRTRLSGGWPAVMARNRSLALAARDALCAALEVAPPCPDEMIGSLAAVPLPDAPKTPRPEPPLRLEPLQDELLLKHRIEVPIIPWPARPKRLVRVAAQLYNSLPQYEYLAQTLMNIL